MPTCRKR